MIFSPGDVSQPEEERQRLIREIIGQSLGGLKIGLLKDIGVVDAALEQPVEAKSDHLLEPLAVAGEELVQRPSRHRSAARASSSASSSDSPIAVPPEFDQSFLSIMIRRGRAFGRQFRSAPPPGLGVRLVVSPRIEVISTSASLSAHVDKPSRAPGPCSSTTRAPRRRHRRGGRGLHRPRLPPGGLRRAPVSAWSGSPRGRSTTRRGGRAAGRAQGLRSLEEMLDDPGGRGRGHRRAAGRAAGRDPPRAAIQPSRARASWPRSRWRCPTARPQSLVDACERAGVLLQVNQNMRYDHSVRALKTLLNRGRAGRAGAGDDRDAGDPALDALGQGGRSLSTFIMSIHHLDTFRYWLGDPVRVLASTRPDPRTRFPHADGINLYILEYAERRAGGGMGRRLGRPGAKGRARDRRSAGGSRGPRGLALGEIGWPGWPERVPSTIDYTSIRDNGAWHRPRWAEAWFPDAFAGTMGGPAPRPGDWPRARHLRPRQPQDDRSV